MKLILNKTKYDPAMATHSRSNTAKYFEIVSNTLTEYQVSDHKHLIYKNTLDGLNHQIKSNLSHRSKHYLISNNRTRKALRTLEKLGIIKVA